MDLSGILVVIILGALALAAIVWMEIQSRKTLREKAANILEKAGDKGGIGSIG